MTIQKNWNLMFVAGNPEIRKKIINDPSNPLNRSDALKKANKLALNNWRVWIENPITGKIIFQSQAELNHLKHI